MAGRFLHTEAGFILEGEVRTIPVEKGAACSVSGLEPDGWHTLERSLQDALRELEGHHVRITVEVVERRPVDALREAVERFRQDFEDPLVKT
jgi:hypothetical protein